MDFVDNISVRSDDTDYLLSMKCHLDGRNNVDERKLAASRYLQTKSYLDSLNSHDSLEQPKCDVDIFSTYDENFYNDDSWRRIEWEDQQKKSTASSQDSIQQEIVIQNSVNNCENKTKAFDFEELDEKVQEGQRIISRVLAEMNSGDRHKYKRSYEGLHTNTMKLSLTPSPTISLNSSPPCINENQQQDGGDSCMENILNSTKNHSLGKDTEYNESLLNEIAILKDKLTSIEIEKSKEIINLKERNEARISSLEQTVNTLQKQKENFTEHILQLKDSLAKKNAKCIQFQDLMKEKAEQINRLITKDDQERTALQNEVKSLQMKKTLLDKQVSELEKALNRQFSQIKELDHCFQRERENNVSQMTAKDEEISSLQNIIRKQNETSMALSEKIINESKLQAQKELKSKETALELLEISLEKEKDRNQRLQHQFKDDVEELLSKMNNLKEANQKLKENCKEMRESTSSTEAVNDTQIVKLKEEMENMKTKLSEYERFEKSLIVSLSEESIKLAAITGLNPPEVIGTPSSGINLGNTSDTVDKFKDQLEQLRSFILSKEEDSLSVSNDSMMMTSPINTSTKLIRHLQNRMKQLRRENGILRNTTIQEHLSLTSDSDELEHVRLLLKQTTKENLLLQKAHAQLQYSIHSTQIVPASCHVKALGPHYVGTTLQKFVFEKRFIPWEVSFPGYHPIEYTSPIVLKKPVWADLDIYLSFETPKFNKLDGEVDRRSHLGDYVVENGRPFNPIGRTGMSGRGLLGRWGPNHTADPIVTCWLRDVNEEVRTKDGKPILQFVAIQRKDSGEWAIPGGMVDAGETVSSALKREFSKEALSNDSDISVEIEKFFSHGTEIYRGYVDDPRNTDNAWIETIVMNFHDNDHFIMSRVPLLAGDDAQSVQWLAIDGYLDLYANHYDFIRKTCELHHAYFPS